MHGQKKRRKRTLGGLITVEGYKLKWLLLSEPQKSTAHGLIGLRITVCSEDEKHRELLLEYPFPDKHTGNGAFQIPQRPKFSEKAVETGVRRAIESGWDPLSRGKAMIYRIPKAIQPALPKDPARITA
jgi:hypothetical protein